MRSSKTVTLNELRLGRDRQRTETKEIGLYTITRTSEPLDISSLARQLSPGESVTIVDEPPLPRVKEWLDNILAGLGAIRSDRKQTKSVKAFAERCSIPAMGLRLLLDDMTHESSHSAQFVAQAIEIAAELADEWQSLKVNATLEKPIARYRSSTKTAIANTAKTNAKKKADADLKAVAAFDVWKETGASLPRRNALAKLSRGDQVKNYLKVGKPKDRAARRLRAMLKDGRIK